MGGGRAGDVETEMPELEQDEVVLWTLRSPSIASNLSTAADPISSVGSVCAEPFSGHNSLTQLQGCVLGVTHAPHPSQLHTASLAGLLFCVKVDNQESPSDSISSQWRLHLLSPCGDTLPSPHLLVGDVSKLKWSE
eukprot:GHVR01043111.1.p1 GENE.GHVR01043111.1~~GHVR01043111.1.p1  ORF type:complete len:136 (+),score=44.10 GHVR01043111.1:232-639(+)